MPTVLVTGGAGYIGSHTAKGLAQAGYEVIVYDNLSAGHEQAVLGRPLVKADIRETDVLRDTLRRHRVEAVLHFAAWLSVGDSVKDPIGYYRNNVMGTLSVLEAMVAESVSRLVFSSTAAVYGDPIETPIVETHPTRPVNAYGETKLAVERTFGHFERAYGLRAIALRYFNASGADPDGEIGENHDPEYHLIPRAIGAAHGEAPLEIFGDDYPTPDGTCLRDFVHVSDLADAHVLALASLERGGPTGAYNLGNGRPHSVRDVMASIERVTGRPVHAKAAPRRAGDPGVLFASSDKIKRDLGWKPRFESLDTIVETAWNWYRRSANPSGA